MSFSLLEKQVEGWLYPYRSKKAHLFKTNISFCGKWTISDGQMNILLPQSTFLDIEKEGCKACLQVLKLIKANPF